MSASSRTHPLYQHDQALHQSTAKVISCQPLDPAEKNDLSEWESSLFKDPAADEFIVITDSTIFHAQGGGQPADSGSMTMVSAGDNEPNSDSANRFNVSSVRHGQHGRILHRGKFSAVQSPGFEPGQDVRQQIDSDKRNLHCRLHTAGHLIGLAIRHLATARTPSIVSNGAAAFSEGKANHYPGDSRVESTGLIAGEHRAEIQKLSNEYVQRKLAVTICFCSEMGEVRRRCGEDITKDMKITDDMKQEGGMRIVEVEGLGGYPCGGTHLPLTSDVRGIVVTGIKRQKGVSKVSYNVVDDVPEEDRITG